MGLNALMVGDMVSGAVQGAVNTLIELGKPPQQQPRFFETAENYTMRQSGLSAIRSSQMQTRSALMREASLMHQ
jgi:hypothetical protein